MATGSDWLGADVGSDAGGDDEVFLVYALPSASSRTQTLTSKPVPPRPGAEDGSRQGLRPFRDDDNLCR